MHTNALVDDTLAALADPVRRHVVELRAERPMRPGSPMASSIHPELVTPNMLGTKVFEPGANGRLRERYDDGTEFVIGSVGVWEPRDVLWWGGASWAFRPTPTPGCMCASTRSMTQPSRRASP